MADALTPSQVASIAARLRNAGQALGLTPEQLRVMPVQMVYAQQGFLGRLDQSPHAQRFVLKGGSSLFTRFRELGRPTRDLDLASIEGPAMPEEVESWIRDICTTPFGDGLVFPVERIRARSSAPESAAHPVVQVNLTALLGKSQIPLDLDVSFGNVIHPGLVLAQFPRFVIGQDVPVRIYPLEQVVTEKFAAMVELTVSNTRMKDFHDLWQIAHFKDALGAGGMQAEDMAEAMQMSFRVRRTPLANIPFVLDPAFTEDAALQRLWNTYRGRNPWVKLPDFPEVLRVIRLFAGHVATSLDTEHTERWNPATLTWDTEEKQV